MDTSIMLLVLGSAVLHAGWNFAARRAKGDVVVMWLSLLVAGIVSSPAAAAWAWSRGDWSLSWHCVAATVLIHTLYFLLVATAYQTGEISMVYPVARGAGVAGTTAIVMIFTVEQVSSRALAGILSVCVGTVLLGAARFNPHRSLRALRFALLVGVSIVAYSLVDKHGARGSQPALYIAIMFLGSGLLMTPYVLYRHNVRILHTLRVSWRYILCIGPAALVTYLMILVAFRTERVSYVVAFREVAVVFGSILGFVFLKDRLTPWKALGLVAVVVGLVLIKLA